ncbi:MAG: glycosyltransferase [Beijerinckiaceae bacterium]|nr:glycosyltransferase [Beijerinckiaceae bacterium]
MSSAEPLVSVVIAAFNSELYIEAAVSSVVHQTLSDIEIIIVDDGSPDETLACVRRLALRDDRIRILALPTNGGVSRARNAGIEMARGQWVSIVDSDDLICRTRLERLVEAGERDQADIVCDNMLFFYDEEQNREEVIAGGALLKEPKWIDLETYILGNCLERGSPSLGHLQPTIRLKTLRQTGALYDEKLTIAEDYHFVQLLLAAGAKMRVYPWLTYFYRKRSSSASHRLTLPALAAMLDADVRFRTSLVAQLPHIRTALDRRTRGMLRMFAAIELVSAIKKRRLNDMFKIACRQPHAPLQLFDWLAARVSRGIRAKWVAPIGATASPKNDN